MPAQNPAAAAAEIHRLANRDQFVGVFLPGAARIPYGNPIYDPIWQAADETGLPVVVHVHYERDQYRGASDWRRPSGLLHQVHALLACSLQGRCASILCHGIFERYPNVRLLLMEGGVASYPGLLWRLDTNWKACRSETPHCVMPPSESYGITSASAPSRSIAGRASDAPARSRAASTLADALLASDYPHWDFDQPNLTLTGLPADWRTPILGANAAAFYNLDVRAAAAR